MISIKIHGEKYIWYKKEWSLVSLGLLSSQNKTKCYCLTKSTGLVVMFYARHATQTPLPQLWCYNHVTDASFIRVNLINQSLISCSHLWEGYKKDKVKALGYRDYIEFLYGKSLNPSYHGWHRENMTAKSLFDSVYINPLIEARIMKTGFRNFCFSHLGIIF